MTAGFNDGRTAYYSKSQDGLWVRSCWNHDVGVIDVSWNERTLIDGDKVFWLDENGTVTRTEDVRFAKYSDDSWVSSGVIHLDRPGFIEFARGNVGRVIESVMSHTSRLAAFGFGESIAEVVEWFERPQEGLFVVSTEYMIHDGVGMLEGSDGLVLEVVNLENEVLSMVVRVEGHESFELVKDLEPGMLRDFLISTEPLRTE